ncbi:hypothetical protein [Halotalea alkalilenta]|uniref:Uncharacterized protein n=1 Tax=Halotalea alkalilenta TaxID=376489 RepID=A0A172YC87_9GAMM|nr:hypothetical protein [Halotalea alkalilenta]ANF56834.1 hypothetical protein A5892_04595 [Halotalea alkalilenta]
MPNENLHPVGTWDVGSTDFGTVALKFDLGAGPILLALSAQQAEGMIQGLKAALRKTLEETNPGSLH